MNYLNKKNKELNIFIVYPQSLGAVHTSLLNKRINRTILEYRKTRDNYSLCFLCSNMVFCVA